MNCFEWGNRTSDYLDGTLIGAIRDEADSHLESCASCSKRFQHYRSILGALGSQDRKHLPVQLRKSPTQFILPKNAQTRASRWERAPWFIRTSIEGLGIGLTILFVVALIPRIRAIYERSLERNIDVFSLAELTREATSTKDAATPALQRGRLDLAPATGTETSEPMAHDDFASEVSDEDVIDDNDSNVVTDEADPSVRVGNNEIWRFNLKTDSPKDLRPRVIQVLTGAGVAPATSGIGGIEAPGGIQFDLFAPKTSIGSLKVQLERLVNPAQEERDFSIDPILTTKFQWFRSKSKRNVPQGKARVVIWLSQM